MASDRFLILRDSDDVHLVARKSDGEPIDWEAWKVDDRGAHGPQPLGSWLRFNPSDYEEADGPHPAAVEALIASLS